MSDMLDVSRWQLTDKGTELPMPAEGDGIVFLFLDSVGNSLAGNHSLVRAVQVTSQKFAAIAPKCLRASSGLAVQ